MAFAVYFQAENGSGLALLYWHTRLTVAQPTASEHWRQTLLYWFDRKTSTSNLWLVGAGVLTFEDRRKENFEKGQAELERRRAMLREQQQKDEEARVAAEKAEMEKRERIR